MKIVIRRLTNHNAYWCEVEHNDELLIVVARPRDLRTFMAFRVAVFDQASRALPFVRHAQWRAMIDGALS